MIKRMLIQALAGLLAGLIFCSSACASPAGRLPSLAAPKLALPDLAGQSRPLGAFLGRVVLVEFFATWCEPCRTSLATHNEWQREHGDKGLVVIAVSLDERGAAVAGFAQRYAPDLLVLLDPDAIYASRLKVRTLPAAYLFDRAGNLVSSHVGTALTSLRAEVVALVSGY